MPVEELDPAADGARLPHVGEVAVERPEVDLERPPLASAVDQTLLEAEVLGGVDRLALHDVEVAPQPGPGGDARSYRQVDPWLLDHRLAGGAQSALDRAVGQDPALWLGEERVELAADRVRQEQRLADLDEAPQELPDGAAVLADEVVQVLDHDRRAPGGVARRGPDAAGTRVAAPCRTTASASSPTDPDPAPVPDVIPRDNPRAGNRSRAWPRRVRGRLSEASGVGTGSGSDARSSGDAVCWALRRR